MGLLLRRHKYDRMVTGDETYCPQTSLQGTGIGTCHCGSSQEIFKETGQQGTHLGYTRAVPFRTPQKNRLGGFFAYDNTVYARSLGAVSWYTLPMRISTERIPAVLFYLIWTITLLHIAAEHYYWYWQFRWFDIPMHFLGGVWLGIAGVWLVHHTRWFGTLRELVTPFTAALLAGLCIGILWEGYEFVVWQLAGNGLPVGYIQDTAKDTMMDVIGACVGYIIYRCCFHRSSS